MIHCMNPITVIALRMNLVQGLTAPVSFAWILLNSRAEKQPVKCNKLSRLFN